MKWVNSLQRWSVRGIHGLILGAALLGPASWVIAQAPSTSASKLPNQHFTRSRSFELPVDMKTDERVNISEIRLYTKTPTSNWKIQELGSQFVTRFNCKVAQDGEYWYSLMIVERNGRMTPADVNLLPPQQRVVVDTTPPLIQVQSSNSPDGSLTLRCTVEDANPNPGSLKAVCKTDTGEIALEEVANQPGMFRIKGAEVMKFPVIITAQDLAKNSTSKQINVRELIGTTLQTAQLPSKPAAEIALTAVRPDPASQTPLPSPRVDGPPLLPRVETPSKLEVPPPTQTQSAKPEMFPGLPARVELPTPPQLVGVVAPVQSNPAPNQEPQLKMPALMTEPPLRHSCPYQLINTTHATVDYRIDQVGPSGVGKVEIYMTPDDGQSWHRLGEDPDKRSPAEINLPGDGVFGIRIVITNGNGFGGRAPVRGDAPHCKIEVDSTSPFAQLRSVDVMPTSGLVEIRWNATDKNLGAAPVSLLYRTRTDGSWQPIARNLKNDGVYQWAFPRDAGTQFFFKIEVADQAGNVAHDVSRQPVVIDMTEPSATIVGVTGSSAPRP